MEFGPLILTVISSATVAFFAGWLGVRFAMRQLRLTDAYTKRRDWYEQTFPQLETAVNSIEETIRLARLSNADGETLVSIIRDQFKAVIDSIRSGSLYASPGVVSAIGGLGYVIQTTPLEEGDGSAIDTISADEFIFLVQYGLSLATDLFETEYRHHIGLEVDRGHRRSTRSAIASFHKPRRIVDTFRRIRIGLAESRRK